MSGITDTGSEILTFAYQIIVYAMYASLPLMAIMLSFVVLIKWRREREKLARTSATSVASPATPATPISPPPPPSKGRLERLWGWVTKDFWIKILIAITAGEAISMAVSSGMTPWATASWETPSVLQVGEYFWAHWFAILAIYGALVFILEEVGKDKDRRKRLISTLTTLTVAGFLCYPVGKVADWVMPYSGSVAGVYVRTNSDPNTIVLPPHGRSAPMRPQTGESFSFSGSGFETLCVYTDGHIGIVGSQTSPCNSGPIDVVYVRNMTGKYNTVRRVR